MRIGWDQGVSVPAMRCCVETVRDEQFLRVAIERKRWIECCGEDVFVVIQLPEGMRIGMCQRHQSIATAITEALRSQQEEKR